MAFSLVLAFLVAAPGGAPRYDLAEVRHFLDGIETGIEGYETPALWRADSDIVCIRLERIDAATGVRAALNPAPAVAAARAAGATGEAKIEPGEGPCVALLDIGGRRFDADLVTGTIRERPALIDEEDPAAPRVVRSMFPMVGWDRRENLSPDGAWFQTLIGDDLGLRSANTGEIAQLTGDGTPERRYFQAYDIWEESGDEWSPDSTRFVGRLHDTTGLKGLTRLDMLHAHETVEHFTYWSRAGEPMPVTTLYVFDVATRGRVTLSEQGTPDSYLFFLDWSPDGRRIAYVRVARDATRYELFEADAATGASRLLLEEKAASGWVKWPGPPKTFHYLPDGGGFLWRSDRDGFAGYYLYPLSADGVGAPRKVSPDGFDVTAAGVTPDGAALVLVGAPDPARPYDEQIFRWALDGSGGRQITSGPGVHDVTLSPSGRYLLDTHHDIDRPPVTVIRDAASGEPTAEVQRARLTTARAAWPSPERVVAKAADGKTNIHGVVFRPYGFDPAKSYPVIERIYGGMQGPVSSRGFPGFGDGGDYNTMLAWFAARGFVVVMLDAPGVPGRGRDYLLARHSTWPDGIIADHAVALKAVAAARPWMDLGRVGIDGNSWGGMLALRGGLEAPELYRAVAASVPQTDLRDHVSWIEFQIGTPQANPDAYNRGELASRMKDFHAALLLVAGTADVNVPVSNTMTLLDALAEAGAPYDLVLFPGTNHGHQGRGDRYAYAIAAIARFFERELGAPR